MGIDGEFEFNVMEKGTKFATTDHCGAIDKKRQHLSILFDVSALSCKK